MADATSLDDFYAADGGSAAPDDSTAPTFKSLDDFYGNAPPPKTGGALDTIWNATTTTLGKVANALGEFGEWGAKNLDPESLGLDQPTEQWMKDNGLFNDYQNGHANFLRTFNEAVMRPAIVAGQAAYRGSAAIASGAALGVGVPLLGAAKAIAGDETSTVRNIAATPFGAAGEYLTAIGEGSYPAPELFAGGETGAGYNAALRQGVDAAHVAGDAEHVTGANLARAAGAVGEGDAGYYGVTPITPENLTARAQAAEQASVAMPEPLPPPVDVHELARRIDPETINTWDRLEAQRAVERDTLAKLEEQRQAAPEVAEARKAVDDILGFQEDEPLAIRMEREDAYRASAPEPMVAKLNEALARLDSLTQGETPEMVAARERLVQADYAMRDLAVPLSDAYRQAREIAPNLPEAPEPAVAAPAERARATATAAGATKEGQAATAAPNVVGEPLGAGLSLEPGPAAPEAAVAAQGEPTGELAPIEGTGEQLPRRVAQRTEENAIASGLTDVSEDVPTYARLKDEDQARIAVEVMDKDYERAIRIAMGDEAPPAGATPEAFLIGVEKRAISEGDFETFNRLRGTKLAEAGTTMGQRISTYRTRMESSPLEAIQEVQQARQAASQVDIPTATRQIADEVKAEVKAVARQVPAKVKVDKLAAFLDQIRCQ